MIVRTPSIIDTVSAPRSLVPTIVFYCRKDDAVFGNFRVFQKKFRRAAGHCAVQTITRGLINLTKDNMSGFRPTKRRAGMLGRLFMISALLFVVNAANADGGDSTCLSLYPKSGAVQGTSPCRLTAASNTPVGMGSYSCTANLDLITQWCNSPPDGTPEDSCPVADPVYPATGATILTQADFVSGDDVPLTFQRTYRAQPMTRNDAGIGSLWLHNWQMKLGLANATSSMPQVFAYRADGSRITFNKSSGTWRTAGFSGLALMQDGSGWTLIDLSTETTESYSPQGVLLSINTRNGRTFTLTYSDAATPSTIAPALGLLVAVSEHAMGYSTFGDIAIRFAYDQKRRLTQMTDPTGAITKYAYDTLNNLVSVTWPDGNVRRYVYDDSRFGGALTGVIDETGKTIATWTYDAMGRATSVAHPDTTRNVQLSYGSGTTIVTDGTGSNTLNYSWLGDKLRPLSGSSPKGTNSLTWDASGNLLAQANPAGSSSYTYDDVGRPARLVVNGINGTTVMSVRYADATTLRPYMIASPGKMRAFAYDAQGNITGISDLTTDDPTGENGFDAHASDGQQTTYGAYYIDNSLSYLEMYQNGVMTGAWGTIFDNSGNLRSVSSRFPGWEQPFIFARDAAHRIAGVSIDEFSADAAYDARGRVTSFRIFTNARPESGNVKRTLRVEYGYSPDGKVNSRTGTLETDNGGATTISSDTIDQWLNNYENGVTPIVPADGAAESQNVSLQTDIDPVCVECYVYAKFSPVLGPDARALYNPQTGVLTAGGPVDIAVRSLLITPPAYSSSFLNSSLGSNGVSSTDGGMVKCHDDGCASEAAACKITCSDAAGDFRKPNIWYRRFNKCFAGCYPARCGGNPYRGFTGS